MKNQGNLVPLKDYSSLLVTAPQNMKICDLPNLIQNQGFLGGSDGNESACNEGDLDLILGLGRYPGRGHDNPLQYSCLENPHGQRSLVGYSPWDHKELDKYLFKNVLIEI